MVLRCTEPVVNQDSLYNLPHIIAENVNVSQTHYIFHLRVSDAEQESCLLLNCCTILIGFDRVQINRYVIAFMPSDAGLESVETRPGQRQKEFNPSDPSDLRLASDRTLAADNWRLNHCFIDRRVGRLDVTIGRSPIRYTRINRAFPIRLPSDSSHHCKLCDLNPRKVKSTFNHSKSLSLSRSRFVLEKCARILK